MSSSLGHLPSAGKPWTFDASVAACFPDMLQRSIPDYAGMRDAVLRLALRYARPGTDVVDLGASRGDGVEKLHEALGDSVSYSLVERAPAMLEALRERWKGRPEGSVLDLDLRHEYPSAWASVTLAILTLQFVPLEHRIRVVQDAYDRTLPGGALVVVEKVLGSSSALQNAFVEEYHALKREHGYSAEEVAAKAEALEGALVPVSAAENERMLRAAGFRHVETFWRWMSFAGWIAIKD